MMTDASAMPLALLPSTVPRLAMTGVAMICVREITDFLDQFVPLIQEYHTLLTTNAIFVKRTAGIGLLTPEMAISFGTSGPVLRGSGIDHDLRRDGEKIYTRMYDGHNFALQVAPFDVAPPEVIVGDNWCRFYVRMAELVESMYSDMGVTAKDAAKTPKVIIDEMFESPELRTLMYRLSVEFGVGIDTAGAAGMMLTALPWMIGCWRIAKGGTHTLAKAMTQACYAHGVDLIENTEVEKIIIEDGRAVGVIARGREFRATKCVVTNADPKQTLLQHVGEEHLPAQWVRRAKNFRFGPSHVLATPMYCLYEAPDYSSARWDPDINKTHYTVVGYDTPEECIRYIRDAYSGIIPEPAAGTWVNSLWDPSQAPEGRHSATGWYFFPCASEVSAEDWAEVRATYNDRFLKRWEQFAPNMTRDNVIADALYTPDQMERKNYMWEGDFSNGEMSPDQMGPNRPWPEAADYRLHVPGLYLCGPSAYPGGGMHAAPGYNAYKAIAEDLGLPSPATERGY